MPETGTRSLCVIPKSFQCPQFINCTSQQIACVCFLESTRPPVRLFATGLVFRLTLPTESLLRIRFGLPYSRIIIELVLPATGSMISGIN